MENLKQIIEKLEQTRKDKDLSYEQVAKMINSSRSTIWKILTHLAIPSADTFLRLIDALEYDFKVRKKSTIENFLENVNQISKEQVKEVEPIITDAKIKGKWNEKTKPKEKTTPKTKKVASEPKKEVLECQNCTYETLKSGIKILLKKCNDCKTKKK